MKIVDERGRVFGRFNVIDAAIVLVVLLLVPLAFAAYRLFRPEAMQIVSVEPSRVMVGQQPRVRLRGQHLRPYLRAQVGAAQPHNFLIESPEEGEFVLPELPIGTFDLALYDEVQEVARLKNAVTVAAAAPGPHVSLQLIGAFFGLDAAQGAQMIKGRTFPNQPGASIEIVEAGAPREDVRRIRPIVGSEATVAVPVPGSVQVPATLRAACLPGGENQNCAVNGTVVSPGVTIAVAGGFSFVVDAIRADAPIVWIKARLQFVGRPEVIDLLAAGDVDGTTAGGGARIVAVVNRQARTGQLSRQIGAGRVVESTTVQERFASADVDAEIPVDRTSDGYAYRSMPIKPGGVVTFETSRYVAHGAVVSIASVPAKGGGR